MNDLPEDLIGDDVTEEISSGVFEFRSKTLHRFSFDRQAAWQRLRDSSGAENDALMVFLCTLESSEVIATRGARAEAAFFEKLSKWCDAEKITIHSDNPGRKLVNEIAKQIVKDLEAAGHEPELKDSKGTPSPNGSR